MTAANTDRLERVLGPGWQTWGYQELCDRSPKLEVAAGFTRTLTRYMQDLHVSTAGQALAVLAERQANGNGAVVEPPRREETPEPPPLDDPVMRALAAELGIDALA